METTRFQSEQNTKELLDNLNNAIKHFSINAAAPDDEIQHIGFRNSMFTLYAVKERLEEEINRN